MTNSFEEQLRQEHPQARITVSAPDDSGPYRVYDVVIRKRVMAHNPNYPDDNKCLCGHAYYRHFDPYENWDAVGCKHCGCGHFVHEVGAPRLSPFARMERFGQWHVRLEDYLVQWEMFGHAYYPTLADYLGATPKAWTDITDPPVKESTDSASGYGGYGANRFGVGASSNADDDEFVEVL